MADCAFEPKNFVASSVGIHKNEKSHQLDSHLGGNQSFNDTIYSTAYGQNGLGNKLYGNRSNVSNLTAYVVQNFQNTFVTPDRVVIAATGVENHQEFVDLVNEKISSLNYQLNLPQDHQPLIWEVKLETLPNQAPSMLLLLSKEPATKKLFHCWLLKKFLVTTEEPEEFKEIFSLKTPSLMELKLSAPATKILDFSD